MARVAAPAYEGERRPSRRLRAALAALLEHLEGEREMGTLAVAYLLGAGPKDPERRARVLTTLRSVVEDGHSHAKPTHKPSPLTAEILLGGALAIIHARLHTNQGRLIPLVNPLMSMIVQPYLGSVAAAKELRRTPPEPAETPPERRWRHAAAPLAAPPRMPPPRRRPRLPRDRPRAPHPPGSPHPEPPPPTLPGPRAAQAQPRNRASARPSRSSQAACARTASTSPNRAPSPARAASRSTRPAPASRLRWRSAGAS
jgi:hypothetical protein